MKEKIIKKEEFLTTKWAGGETTQLFIYPEESDFSKRDFLFRISSATFTSTESQFSNFEGFQRYILPLEGNLKIYHKGLYNRDLKEYDVEYFDGGWITFSKNTIDCRDYNYILKSGSKATMQILSEGDLIELNPSSVCTLFSKNDFELSSIKVAAEKRVDGFSLYVIEADEYQKVKISRSSSPVIFTLFKVD